MHVHAGFIGVHAGLIVNMIQHNIEAGDKLSNVYCCLENSFCQRYHLNPMQFQTAIRYARRKGWVS